MKTIDAVRRSGVALGPDATLKAVGGVMESSGVGTVVIVDDDVVVGIVTDRDLVCRGLAKSADPQGRVDNLMSSPVVTIDADADLRDAFKIFSERAIRRLVVVRGSEFVGIISIDDLLMDLVDDLGHLIRPITAEVLFGEHDSSVPDLPAG